MPKNRMKDEVKNRKRMNYRFAIYKIEDYKVII
jgi:hypothetical protein